jgi:hypothetical protein
MSDSEGFGLNRPKIPRRRGSSADQPHPSAVGSPLPIGGGASSPQSQALGDTQHYTTTPPPPGRTLANSSNGSPMELPSSLQRAASTLRAWLPFVQRILPLLDGNIGTAVSNILTPFPHPQHTPPPPQQTNLEPIEDGLAELQTQHIELRSQIVEQNTSIKRVEDQLELVREATDRNTLEQQELLEDLKGVGNKVNVYALVALALLLISVLLNVILYLHIQRVLP